MMTREEIKDTRKRMELEEAYRKSIEPIVHLLSDYVSLMTPRYIVDSKTGEILKTLYSEREQKVLDDAYALIAEVRKIFFKNHDDDGEVSDGDD